MLRIAFVLSASLLHAVSAFTALPWEDRKEVLLSTSWPYGWWSITLLAIFLWILSHNYSFGASSFQGQLYQGHLRIWKEQAQSSDHQELWLSTSEGCYFCLQVFWRVLQNTLWFVSALGQRKLRSHVVLDFCTMKSFCSRCDEINCGCAWHSSWSTPWHAPARECHSFCFGQWVQQEENTIAHLWLQ